MDYVELAENYERLYLNQLNMIEANSMLVKEKVQRELKVFEALKYALEIKYKSTKGQYLTWINTKEFEDAE